MRAYILAGLAVAASIAASAAPIRATIDSGVLVGETAGGVASFKGVPYVAPPVGPLRWAPPQPVKAWPGDHGARAYGPICPQRINADGSPNEGGAFGVTNEDCLTLNVWAPPGAVGGPAKTPVMVWLHGGGNALGAGSLGAYDGSAFVRDGVIVVSINYRLGTLGFFAHPALTRAASPGDPLASYGVMDQIAALKWVARNIAAFGGDPANVTVFGESAGGADILTLMASPLARGLFTRAIVESGGGWGPPATLEAREKEGDAVAQKAGAPAGATVDQLRALPVDALVKATPRDVGPAVDGRLLTESPTQAFAGGRAAKVPLLIGSNSYEASLIATAKLPPALALAMLPKAPRTAYPDVKDDQALVDAMFTDAIMGGPARWVAGQASGGPAWLYHFAYVPEGRLGKAPGAAHASEIPFVFDTWDGLGVMAGGVKLTAKDKAVVAVMHSCWAAFAKTGKPDCTGAPTWPAYTTARDTLMDFDGAPPSLKTHFRKTQLDAQESVVLPKLGVGP
jgi:para-nitrobenzyl esterase